MKSQVDTTMIDSGAILSVTIPGTVDARLSPNAREHWRTTHRLKQERLDAAYWNTRATVMQMQRPPLTPPLTLHFLVAWEKGRKTMDDDNIKASMKSIIDGIAMALEVDDRHITTGTVTQTRAGNDTGHIVVEIVEQEGKQP